MELDHLFVFIAPGGPELSTLVALGLQETYRREHPGQGTANACFAFDNLYLELLWLTSESEALDPRITRMGLLPRARWREADTCPFGLAWRGTPANPIETWDYRPPYLPAGLAIAAAVDSDDPRQPLMFSFPGTTAPLAWPAERRRGLQRAAGFGGIVDIALVHPHRIVPSLVLRRMSIEMKPPLRLLAGESWQCRISVARLAGGAPVVLTLPSQAVG